MNEKERRNTKVLVAGSLNEEGRLKIEKINKYRSIADEKKKSAIISLVLTAIDAIVMIISSNHIQDESIKTGGNIALSIVGIAYLLRAIIYGYMSRKNSKIAYNLEEEVIRLAK